MPSKSSTTKTARRSLRRMVGRVYVEIAWVKKQMPKYVVPSIKDPPDYNNGYSAAVAELHRILDAAANS